METSNLWELVQLWLDEQWNPPSQAKLAARLEVSPALVSDWKYGRSSPNPAALEKLAEVMGESPRKLLEAVNRDQGYLPPVTDRSAG